MRGLNVLVLSGFLIAAVVPHARAMGDAGFIQESLTGTAAAGFVLPTVKGKEYNFKVATAGKKAILVFWATWCPHCRVALKEINAVASQIAANHVEVVFIDVGEDKQSVVNYLNRHKYEFDVVLDENGSVGQEYQVSGIPKVLFVDEQGTIKSVGYEFPKNYMDEFK